MSLTYDGSLETSEFRESLRIEKCVLYDESWQRQPGRPGGFCLFCVSWVKYKTVQGVNDGEVGSCWLAQQFHRQLSFI